MSFYQLPQGAYPHDVAPAPDGSVWISGQQQGFAGRFDPKTGALEKVPLGPGAAPHGVIVGPDGNAWLTEGGQNAIARVDAKTRAVTLFALPKEFSSANLNTLVFDKTGRVWFTGQNGVHGRVDPVTGKVDAWASPRGRGSYGIAVTPAGDIWYASLAGDYIGKVDLATGNVTVVDPPRKGSARAGSGRTPRACCGRASGTRAASAATTRTRSCGRTIRCRRASPAPTRSMSTTRTGSGRPTGWRTRSSASIRRARPIRASRATSARANVRQMLGRPGEAWGGESGTDRLVVVRD